jgi:hypothetical protein
MNAADWSNIARCANERVLAQTFSFDDEENNILGDLQTREMALAQAYRETLIASVYWYITQQITKEFDREDLLEDLEEQTIRGISIQLLTD